MVVIRKATRDDVPTILRLIRDLAEYEKEPHQVVATEEDLHREGFGDKPSFHCLIAEDAGTPIGFALYFFTYSTWTGTRCLWLEDLFVRPDDRGRGAGILMMKTLAREAVSEKCKRFVWQVLDWNTPSIQFYEKLGAKIMNGWLTVRLEGEALAALGGSI
jgi:GNAT superfamily N-acetyltransferase